MMKLTKNERILSAAEAMDELVRERRITKETEGGARELSGETRLSVCSSRYHAEVLLLRARVEQLCRLLDPEGADQILGKTQS